ncbi:unnamed protein product [Caenorhabditis auriculariae]|uniref:Uncharacterized protein n=1 Tax=Caenorhabditis auriculariae TaxID=2777116 RepID=A0A8S1GN45_9PELO|nr:unnamed protein product [Caenorhabditis auriculariae]
MSTPIVEDNRSMHDTKVEELKHISSFSEAKMLPEKKPGTENSSCAVVAQRAQEQGENPQVNAVLNVGNPIVMDERRIDEDLFDDDWEDERHPCVTIYVRTLACSSIAILAVCSASTLWMSHQDVFCYFRQSIDPKCGIYDAKKVDKLRIFEFVVKILLEILLPIQSLVFFTVMAIGYACFPKLFLGLPINYEQTFLLLRAVFGHKMFEKLCTAMGLVHALCGKNSQEYTDDYFWYMFVSLFWFYAMLNLQIFKRLLYYDVIRTQERWNQRQLDALNPP